MQEKESKKASHRSHLRRPRREPLDLGQDEIPQPQLVLQLGPVRALPPPRSHGDGSGKPNPRSHRRRDRKRRRSPRTFGVPGGAIPSPAERDRGGWSI